jgi:hypothetical protein
MILSVNNDCTVITVTSEEGIIADITAPETTDCCTVLELGTNCCTPTIEIPIFHLYTLNYNVTGCGVNTSLDPDGYYLDITLTGIDAGCVSSLTYPSTNSDSTTTETNPTDLTFRYNFNQIGPSGDLDFEVSFTTCNELEYSLEFTVSIGNLSDVCNTISEGSPTVTFPDSPVGVSIINSTTMELLPEAFGFTSDTFPDGIYYVGLTQTNTTGNISESDTIFVDCNTTCRIIDVLANDLCSDIYLLWNALQYSFDCDTITYEQQCDLWFVIGKQLGYFVNTPCTEPKTSCGTCNK